MRFHFNDRKAAQAAAFLLNRIGGKTTYGVLIKLLYLADRAKLLEVGSTITGDWMVSMRHGPVLSGIYNIVCEDPDQRDSAWFEYISLPVEYHVELIADPKTDELSDNEQEILSRIARKFGRWTFTQLRNYTHDLPEWEDPGNSSRPIRPERILRLEGWADDDIEELTEAAEETWRLEELAARVRASRHEPR